MLNGVGGSAPSDTSTALLDLAAAWREVQQAQARFSQKLAAVDRSPDFGDSGVLSLGSWLAARLNMSHFQASQQLMLARRLEKLPLMAESFTEGRISYQHAAQIASAARRLGSEVVAEHEATLVTLAEQASPRHLGQAISHLENAVDPDGSLAFFDQQVARNRLEIHRFEDGMVSLRGIFDPLAAEIITTAVESMLKPRSSSDARPAYERRADAFIDVFAKFLESRQRPRRGHFRPRVTVVTTVATLKGIQGAPGGELGSGQVVPSGVVRQLACDAEVVLGYIEPDGKGVKLSRARRTVSDKMWEKLVFRDRHCRGEGCDAPPSRSEAHHILPWEEGGPTLLENLVMLWGLLPKPSSEPGNLAGSPQARCQPMPRRRQPTRSFRRPEMAAEKALCRPMNGMRAVVALPS